MTTEDNVVHHGDGHTGLMTSSLNICILSKTVGLITFHLLNSMLLFSQIRIQYIDFYPFLLSYKVRKAMFKSNLMLSCI